MNLAKKIKKLKQSNKPDTSIARRESELECFKRVRVTDIPLAMGIHPAELKKTLTNPKSAEIDRVYSRVLLNRQVQETIVGLTANYGIEFVEKFLKSNGENIQNNKTEKSNKVPTKKAKRIAVEVTSLDEEKEDKVVGSNVKQIAEIKSRKQEKLATVSSGMFKKEQKSVDSFFIDPSGENYYASVRAAESSQSESEDDKVKKPSAKKFKKPAYSKEIISKVSPASTQTVEPSVRAKTSKIELSDGNIHPSWKAKADLRKSQIQVFSGTKIKFDD